MKKILVIGLGYVGFAQAVLLAQRFSVTCLDNDLRRVQKINDRKSYLNEPLISEFLEKDLDLKAVSTYEELTDSFDAIFIALPTPYSDEILGFDTSIITNELEKINKLRLSDTVVIKSTVPIGFCAGEKEKYDAFDIIFSPEFSREGLSLQDTLNPERIILGGETKRNIIEKIYKDCISKDDILFLRVSSCEAEAIKLFANSYLAMRVAFFNELDNFALSNNMSSKSLLEGVCSDSRIGNFYNNPSFGYGGYCLPKDIKQLSLNFKDIPNDLITSVIESNSSRTDFLLDFILQNGPSIIGIYGLGMKKGSDNLRESAVVKLIERLKSKDAKIIIFDEFLDYPDNSIEQVKCFKDFHSRSDIIIANRLDKRLAAYPEKVFSRDIYRVD